jgi:hypothetical protein
MSKRMLLAVTIIPLALSATAGADDVRQYTQGGVTYQDVIRTVRAPKTEIQCVERPLTCLQERYDVQYYDSVRTSHVPITEYRWEPYWRGRYNPFVQPYLTYRYVPRTQWETRTQVVKVPVSTRRLVPVTTTVRVPITTQTLVDQDVVVSRSVVGPSIAGAGPVPAGDPFASPTPAVAVGQQASAQRVGGVARYSGNDPPRRGLVDVNSAGGTRLANGAAKVAQPQTAKNAQSPPQR